MRIRLKQAVKGRDEALQSGVLSRDEALQSNPLDLLFPPVCLVCHRRISKAKDVLCPDCRDRTAVITDDYCTKCGTPLKESFCQSCAEHDYVFSFSRSVYQYGDVIQALIHELKYQGFNSPAKFLAEGMQSYTKDNHEYAGYDLVMSVPLHRVRKRERGYNQSELIARKLARSLDIPYSEPVQRKYYTQSQTLLSSEERKHNLKDAFRARKNLQGKKIILVDDVFTTGSTVNEISKTLREAGASKIAVITASRAV